LRARSRSKALMRFFSSLVACPSRWVLARSQSFARCQIACNVVPLRGGFRVQT
jgi:hypothetical protein